MGTGKRTGKPRCGLLLAAAPWLLPAIAAHAQTSSLDWDRAFADRSGSGPVHFLAEYRAGSGTHRLEEWRTGDIHLRRLTDARIDLHADRIGQAGQRGPAADASHLWQVIDLEKRIDNRISTPAMFQAGIFYSFYAMAHVLSRPAGAFRLSALPAERATQLPGASCSWFELASAGQASTRICWSAALGIPLEIRTHMPDGAWPTSFQVRAADRRTIPAAVFAVDDRGLTVRDHDQAVADD